MSNELLQEMTDNKAQQKALEAEATRLEQAARECRAKRAELKGEEAKLQGMIENARVVHAVNGALANAEAARAAAEASQAAAEASAKENAEAVERIKAKEAQLDELLAKAAEATKPR